MGQEGLPAISYPPGTILAGHVGSVAYGLSTPESDVDTLGVFVAPTREILGLHPERASQQSIVTSAPLPDSTFHEIGKFCNLALKANPTILELLFLSRYTTSTPEGAELTELKGAFLSCDAVVKSYGGYAKSQATRLQRRHEEGKDGFGKVGARRTFKHAKHCLRLLLQGTEPLRTGSLTLDVGKQKRFLTATAEQAVTNPTVFHHTVEELFVHMDQAAQFSPLPTKPDWGKVEEYVVQVRLAQTRSMNP